jgi:ribosomal protein L7Ae-like RNA K-turn-binding protein
VRFALDPDGVVTPDLAERLPGRGAWTRATRDAVVTAASKGLFARAFKRQARLPANCDSAGFADFIGAELEKRALSALGLARRAGRAHLGFDQAELALREGKAAVLLIAVEASPRIAGELSRLAGDAPVVAGFRLEALSAAFGRENVTYAVLTDGVEASRFLREAARLDGFRPVFPKERAERAESA